MNRPFLVDLIGGYLSSSIVVADNNRVSSLEDVLLRLALDASKGSTAENLTFLSGLGLGNFYLGNFATCLRDLPSLASLLPRDLGCF